MVIADPTDVHSQLDSDLQLLASRLRGWSSSRSPAYRELADALTAAVAVGAIGDRLPPERLLARVAGVSRTTAVASYELLVERGIAERRRGSGTFITQRPATAHICEDPIACVLKFFSAT